MSWGRIWAVFLRYFYYFAKLDHLADLFYWPAIDIFLWGMTSVWIQKQEGGVSDLALAILTGLIFWQIVWRANYEITVNLLQEFWNRNLVNLFSTPLKRSEWVAALFIIGIAKICISMLFGSLLVYLLYTLNVFSVGWAFVPYAVSLTLSGWFMGFLSGGIIVYYGQRVQMLAWMIPYVFALFSAVYYPLSALPHWAQVIAQALPTTHIFEGMRQVLNDHQFSLKTLLLSYLLNFIYLGLSMVFFNFMFEKSRNKGLSRVE
jgi:ABC-2 type transport system permease protein